METMRMGPIGQKRKLVDTEWDEMGRNVISHIIVSYNREGVTSIRFGYVENGALVMSKTYGSSSDSCGSRILRLKHWSEFVTGLSGEICSGYITSLTFHTNQGKHEAVHLTFNSRFKYPEKREFHSGILERHEFGGFFGTCDNARLTTIGFCVKLVLPDAKAIKDENV